jgi:hypothetical protein
MITFPKDTPQFSWTRHIKNKMVFYHLSGAQILRIFRKPARREEGIAANTVAAMQSKNSKQQKVNSKQRGQRDEPRADGNRSGVSFFLGGMVRPF